MKIKVLDNKEIELTINSMSPERFVKDHKGDTYTFTDENGNTQTAKIQEDRYRKTTSAQTTIKEDGKDVYLTADKMNDRNIDYTGVNDVRLEGDKDAQNAAAIGHLAKDNVALESKRSEEQNIVRINLDEAKDVSPTLMTRRTSKMGGDDHQDNEPNANDIVGNLKAEGTKMLTSAFGIGDAIKDIKEIFDPSEVEITEFDRNMTKLQQWKNDNAKTIHTTDWYETPFLNQKHNAANNMKDDFRGELGKSTSVASGGFGTGNAWAALGGDALNMLAGGSNVNTIAQIGGSFGAGGGDAGDASWQADLDEIAVLGTVTKDTMYTNKPGIRIKAHRSDGMVENITGRTENYYNGSYEGKNNPVEAARIRTREKIAAEKERKKPKWFGGATDGDGIITKQEENYSFEYSAAKGLYTWKKDKSPFSTKDLTTEQMQLVTFLRNRNTFNKHLGYLYIRPFYDYHEQKDPNVQKGFRFFDIPFEFNPEISESATTANYASETLLGRLGQFHIFTGTQLPTLNITLTYIALAPDVLSDEDIEKMGKQYSTDSWQYFWSNNKIEEIELKLRSLVFADYVSGDYLIKPPLVELHLENDLGQDMDKIGDLFKYPNGIKDLEGGEGKVLSNNVGGNYLAYSTALHNTPNGTIDSNRYKKYIVTSVQIDKVAQDADLIFPSLYGRKYTPGAGKSNPMYHLTTGANNEKGAQGYAGYTRKKGFKATLQLTEVTENFLDLVPDFKAYYDAWMFKQQLANNQNAVTSYLSGEASKTDMYQKTTDILAASRQELEGKMATGREKLNLNYEITYNLFRLYALANTSNIIKPGSTSPIKNPSKIYEYNSRTGSFSFLKEITDINNPQRVVLNEKSSNMFEYIKDMPINFSNICICKSGNIECKQSQPTEINIKDTVTDIYYPKISKDKEKIQVFNKKVPTVMNMSEAVIYLDKLSNVLEVLRKKQDQLDFEYPNLENIKIKKPSGLNFPLNDNCDITFNNAQEIYDYYIGTGTGADKRTFKGDLDRVKKEIDEAVKKYINDIEVDKEDKWEIINSGYNKPDANTTKGKKFKQITTLEALNKFLGSKDAEKVYVNCRYQKTRWQQSVKSCYEQLNYNVKPEKIAKDFQEQISKTWPFKRISKLKELVLNNAQTIVSGGDFNILKETESKKNVVFQLPQVCEGFQFVSIQKHTELTLEDFEYTTRDGKTEKLQIYDYDFKKTEPIMGVKDVMAGIEEVYNNGYKAFTALANDSYSAEIKTVKVEEAVFNDSSMLSDVNGFTAIGQLKEEAENRIITLLDTNSKKFEDQLKTIDQNYKKEKIVETIDTYFKFSSVNGKDNKANDLYKKDNQAVSPNSFTDAVPKEDGVFDIGKSDDNTDKLFCYKTNDEYTLKLVHFPDERMDYDEEDTNEADHGLIWQLEKKEAYFNEISADLSKATNEQALKNYDKLSGSSTSKEEKK